MEENLFYFVSQQILTDSSLLAPDT